MSSFGKISPKQVFFDAIDDFHSQNRNEWRWVESPYFLKTFPEEDVISYLNLMPFKKPEETELLATKLEISMEKPLNFHPNLGWNWHKSWILPEITVKLTQNPADSKVFIRIFVVKAGLEYSENFFLVDIGVKGCNKVFLENQAAVFRNLKFSSTSYNNEGLKFHLVVVGIEELEEENGKYSSNYRIINSKLSPPIYVDSRKSAREISFKESSFLDMFSPELLIKPLFKKRRKNVDKKEEFIGNSLKGFIDYYTAPNIRNKIKHPFFIALKFSNCIQLHFNRNYFQSEKNAENFKEILSFLQQYNENLSKIYAKKKKTKIFLKNAVENTYLAIVIKNPNNLAFSKKVSEFLGSFDKRIIKIVLHQDELTEKYQLIEDLAQLQQIYHEEYEKLNYDGKEKLPTAEFFLEKRPRIPDEFLNNKNKKIKIDKIEESEDFSETANERKSESHFIPEITTMIDMNEWQLINKKEKEKSARMNPEELFKIKAGINKKDENQSNANKIHQALMNNYGRNDENSNNEYNNNDIINNINNDNNNMKIEDEDLSKKTEIQMKYEKNDEKMPNIINNNNNNRGFSPNYTQTSSIETLLNNQSSMGYYGNPQISLLENYNYMNNLFNMNLYRTPNINNGYSNYEEYRAFLETLRYL